MMAVCGQLCRGAEVLSYHDITLTLRHPPPSPQKANPVQKLVLSQKIRRAGPFKLLQA
jgi:hypothetical protein